MPSDSGLVLADIPERNRLRELQRQLEERRDGIAELDLEIETVRDALWRFEMHYRGRLFEEHTRLARIDGVVHHLGRWTDLLRDEGARRIAQGGRRIETRRQRELDEREEKSSPPQSESAADPDHPKTTAQPTTKDERLKAAYRALARRFHPDLARSEEERLRFGELMARINALYRAADLERLLLLAEQAKGGDIEDSELALDEQREQLESRLRWFDAVLQNLQEERAALERTPTCVLWRNVEQAAAQGRDLLAELKEELQERVQRSYAYVRDAAVELEAEVSHFNREHAAALEERGKREQALAQFDPFADKRLIRLGLAQLESLRPSSAVIRQADALLALGKERPAILRLVLLTYIAELSPFPLPGLESYEQLAERHARLGKRDKNPLSLEEALVEADSLVEWGVRRATARVVHMGLHFRSQPARDAVPVLLRSLYARRVFKQILGVLGEQEKCNTCRKRVFLVPLFRTHGIDDFRALVCPRCGQTARSYWMPKGKDVQAVLNDAFLDFEIITEVSFRLGRASIGAQLLPRQLDDLDVGALKQRFYDDVLRRYEIEVAAEHVQLWQGGAALQERRRLATLSDYAFEVRFTEESPLREGEALELLRHRARARFRSG